MDYCSVVALRTYLDIGSAGDDALLAEMITAASRWLDSETRRTLVTDTDTTVYIDAAGEHIEGATLHISDFGDISSITSIVNGDGTAVTSGQYTTYPKLVSTDKPVFTRVNLLSSSGISWTYDGDYENAIEITGKWSLYANTVPRDVAHNCKLLAAFLYRQKDPGIFETITIPESGVMIRPKGFPNSVAYWVRRLRKP